jgi:hypothetical protein
VALKVAIASSCVVIAMIAITLIYRNRVADLDKQFATSRHLVELVSSEGESLKANQHSRGDSSDGRRFLENFKRERWGKALRLLANHIGTNVTTVTHAFVDVAVRSRLPFSVQGIALVNVRIADGRDQPRNFELFLSGISTAAEPRINADAYRQQLDESFAQTFQPRAPFRYLALEDLPDKGREHQARFNLSITSEYPAEKP